MIESVYELVNKNTFTGSYVKMSTESGKREINEVDDDDCIGPMPAEAVKTKKRKGIINLSIFCYKFNCMCVLFKWRIKVCDVRQRQFEYITISLIPLLLRMP